MSAVASIEQRASANGRSSVQVVAVDSRPLIRSGLARVASCALGCYAYPAADLAHAGAALKRAKRAVDVILLCIGHDENPKSLLREARQFGAPVVFVLDGDDAALIRDALAAGADGYLMLELADVDSVRSTVNAVLAGASAVPPELQDACSRRGHRENGVTPRAREVLRLLAEGLHDHEIAERLGISVSSVRKHIGTAEGRLQARTRTQVMAIAVRHGLL